MEARRRSRRKRGEKEETHGNNGAVSGNYEMDLIRNAHLGVRKCDDYRLIVASGLKLRSRVRKFHKLHKIKGSLGLGEGCPITRKTTCRRASKLKLMLLSSPPSLTPMSPSLLLFL